MKEGKKFDEAYNISLRNSQGLSAELSAAGAPGAPGDEKALKTGNDAPA